MTPTKSYAHQKASSVEIEPIASDLRKDRKE
uniref:Uncharacterized protein n=1 Tax=Arundo donax TaxID=35708 RepID=A0A0A9C9P0_ARUDO